MKYNVILTSDQQDKLDRINGRIRIVPLSMRDVRADNDLEFYTPEARKRRLGGVDRADARRAYFRLYMREYNKKKRLQAMGIDTDGSA